MHRLVLLLSLLLAGTAAAANDLRGGVVDDAGSTPVAHAHVYVYSAFPKVGRTAICPSCYRDWGKHEAVADGYEPAFARKVDPKSGAVTIRLTPRSSADARTCELCSRGTDGGAEFPG